MKRIVVSVLVGAVLTFSLPIVIELTTYRGRMNVTGSFIDWPLPVMDKVGLGPDCANPDYFDNNIHCSRNAFLILLFYYPLMPLLCSYLTYVIVFRRGVRKRLELTE